MPQSHDSGPGPAPIPPRAAPAKGQTRARILHRLALAQAVLLVIAVLAALPFAIRSMDMTLWERQGRTLYAFPSGQPVPASDEDLTIGDRSFLNIAAVDTDEAAGSVTLAVSGHRVCDDLCPRTQFTFFSMADDAQVRRALPPSASVTLLPNEQTFTHTIQLPIRGQPSLYPFDDYELWLGLAGTVEEEGETTQLTEDLLSAHATITTQNQLREYLMVDPVQIDPDRVRAANDPYELIGVQALRFERPTHLEILTVMLVLLIAGSAIVAVFLREITDLVFGIGSLILAIWGVRSVLVPSPLQVVTSVDLALSVVILFVLLGLSLRAAHYFRKQADLPPLLRFGRRGGKDA
jgi:hypothetical protein